MSLNTQVFTNAGLSKLSAAEAGGTLTITKLVAGDGSATADADLFPLTALISPKVDITINRKTDLGNGKIIVSGAITEASLSAGAPFSLRELGVVAKLNAGPEELYTVSNVYAESPDTVTPGGTSTHAFDVTIQIGRATNVTITLGDPDTVDCQNIPTDATVGPGVYASRSGNIFQFKRLVAGANIQLTELSDRITISLKQIAVNLDLYVPASHPACPDPSVAFATIQAALDYIAPFTIPPDKTVTIHIYKGTFTSNTSLTIGHPNAEQIYLAGEPRVDKTITSIVYLDATHKKVTVTDVTGLVVGQSCYIANSIAGWSGGCIITAIVGLVVTVSTLKRDAQPNFTTTDNGTGRRLSFYPTVLMLNDPGKTIRNISCPNGIGGLSNLTVNGGRIAIEVLGPGVVTNCFALSATYGISASNDALTLTGECVVTDCDVGMQAITGSFTGFGQTYINGCSDGLRCNSGLIGSSTSGQDSTKFYIAHCGRGIYVQPGGNFSGGSIQASSNSTLVFAYLNATALLNPGGGYTSMLDNDGTDLVASGNSYIEYRRNGGGTPTASPAAETIGNQNSLVHII